MSQPTSPSLETLQFLGLDFSKLNENSQRMLITVLTNMRKAKDQDYDLVNDFCDQIVELESKNEEDSVNAILDFYSQNIASIRKWYNHGK